jgi:hypothetical protein
VERFGENKRFANGLFVDGDTILINFQGLLIVALMISSQPVISGCSANM